MQTIEPGFPFVVVTTHPEGDGSSNVQTKFQTAVGLAILVSAVSADSSGISAGHSASLETKKLRVVIADNREFSFRVRTVYRKFSSVGDVVRLYAKGSGEKVELPEN